MACLGGAGVKLFLGTDIRRMATSIAFRQSHLPGGRWRNPRTLPRMLSWISPIILLAWGDPSWTGAWSLNTLTQLE